jgi:tRNA modification GTPase
MDLSEAEAVADLIAAESAAQVRQAIQQLQGALGDRYRGWRDQLIDVLARLEVLVDFPEDDTGHALNGVREALGELEGDLAAAVADGLRGQRIRDGYRVAIIGPPNAGKSSLFNALIAREAAIVADMPGTTRDIIECVMDVEGYRVLIADTAGLHAADNPVEREGIRRALAWAETAARRIWVLDASGRAVDGLSWAQIWRAGDLLVLNKSDLPESDVARRAIASAAQGGVTVLRLSVTRDGSAPVLDWLKADVVAAMAGGDFPSVTRLRHQAALIEALEALRRAAARLDDPELGAEDVRLAARALAGVTGDIATEDVLGKVFATFCIGK